MFAFYLISFFFAHIALLTGVLALFSRLGGYRKSRPLYLRPFFLINPQSAPSRPSSHYSSKLLPRLS